MAVSNLMNEKEIYVREAIENGISAEAINSTLETIIEKSDELGYVPEQLGEMVEVIGNMKRSVENKVDDNYVSDFIKNNNEKIMSALQDGITPEEVAVDLINSINNEDTDLIFHTNLVSEIKKKQLILEREKENIQEKGNQKVLTNNNID